MFTNAELEEKQSINCFNKRGRNRTLQEEGKAWVGFCKLVIHPTQEPIDLSRRFRTLAKPQQYICSMD